MRKLRDRRDPAIWQRWADAAGWAGAPLDVQRWRMRAPLGLEAACGGYGVYLGSAECADRKCAQGQLQRLSDIAISDGAFRLLLQEGALRRKPVRCVREWLLDLTERFRAGRFWQVGQPLG